MRGYAQRTFVTMVYYWKVGTLPFFSACFQHMMTDRVHFCPRASKIAKAEALHEVTLGIV